MEQLIAHLFGDYVLQSHVMAIRKTSSWKWALIHACFYGLPFLLLASEWWQWAIIVGTHAVIDRYRLAAKWCTWYGVGAPGLWWTKADDAAAKETNARTLYESWASQPGYKPWVVGGNSIMQDKARSDAERAAMPTFPPAPLFLGVWLVIIVDNAAHLLINYLVLGAS